MPGLRIGLRHVRYAIAVAEAGSFRRAALALGVAQSAISRRIRDLEFEVGGQLFRRHHGGVEVTPIGKRFLKQARQGADQIRSAVNGASIVSSQKREVRIGVFGPLTMGHLSELFATFRRNRPEARLHFSEAGCPELIAAVRRGQIDVGIVAEPLRGKGYEITHLWVEALHLAMPATHPLAQLEAIGWQDLRNIRILLTDLPTGDFAMKFLRQRLSDRAVNARIEQLPVTRASLLQIVADGDGVTLAGSGLMRLRLSGLVFRRLADATLSFGAVHPRDVIHKDVEHLLSLARSLSGRDPTLL